MIRSAFCALAAGRVAFCVPALAETLRVEAWYRERIALPPEAVFEAVLLDVSRAGAAGEALARARLEPAGGPPFGLEIDYDDAAIRPAYRYAVRATVTFGGRLYFTTDRNYPAFGDGEPLRMLLVRARGGGRLSPRAEMGSGPRSDSPLRNTYWKLTYLGEAPIMTRMHCASSSRRACK